MSRIDFLDGRSLDESQAKTIRQRWLLNHMRANSADFIDSESAKIFCGSYNVNAKKLDGSLSEWLSASIEEKAPDIYAIGFQEIVDLNAMNVALDGSKTISNSKFWMNKVQEFLNTIKGENYVLIGSKHLVGVFLCIYVKGSLSANNVIRDVRTSSTAVGVLGMGNKGGVSIRFNLYDTSLCFVCSHLAAHRENVEGRNADYHSIIEQTIFTPDNNKNNINNNNKSGGWVEKPKMGYLRTLTDNLKILDNDCIFWVGDLNYRIDSQITTQQVFDSINNYSNIIKSNNNKKDKKALKYLIDLAIYDQLNIERSKPNGPFHGFTEGPLLFKPTYKYQPGLPDTYDVRNPKKIRAPAWCDRVLWRHNIDNKLVELLLYDYANLLPSDHKPIYCVVNILCEKLLIEKQDMMYNRLSSKLERYRYGGKITSTTTNSNNTAASEDADADADVEGIAVVKTGYSYFPELTITSNLLVFSKCTYLSKITKSIEIKNTSAVLSIWRFVSKSSSSSSDTNDTFPHSDMNICRRWLSISPSSGLLLPGEIATITFNVTIDAVTAQRMNCGSGSLNDEVILRVENGREHYIAVTATYLRSCFGMSLEELVTVHGPIRNELNEVDSRYLPYYRQIPLNNNSTSSVLGTSQQLSVPAPAAEVDLLGLDFAFDEPTTPLQPLIPVASTSKLEIETKPLAEAEAESETEAPVVPRITMNAINLIKNQPSVHTSPNPATVTVTTGMTTMSIPKELWRLVHVLKSPKILKTSNLFQYYINFSGLDIHTGYHDIEELAIIRECLTCGKQFPSNMISAQGLVVVIGQFLNSLPRPIVPYWLWPDNSLTTKITDNDTNASTVNYKTTQMRSYCRKLLQQLPLLNYNVLIFIFSFLRNVLVYSNENHTTIQRLSLFCDSCLTGNAVDEQKRAAIKEVFEYLLIADDI
jgi:inositol polyphosphate 5-phosphatase INPP5B/F